MAAVRIDHAVTSGTFSLDGETFDVDNNVWIIGDDTECIVIDAPHDPLAIVRLIDGRDVKAVVCTHAHDDHVRWAPALGRVTQAPVLLHPDDAVLWNLTHDTPPDGPLTDGQTLLIGGETIQVLHTPGHAPGAVCLYLPSLGTVFTGDTLFQGGPGATGRSYSDRDTLVASIRAKLFPLPDDTVVKTGHGDDTTIGAEKEALGNE
ncbi:MBL fold metallo-hydrolase [Micropruina sp.]|uniref:MBL fold metallo-hydrolase n=1 Tax=Micropruina sp. TaxID=2737536 RepID=UPI0026352AD5|nr:MBL fold metallo-hydrolase [Micropruina sp.]